jgi:hypothetical protein
MANSRTSSDRREEASVDTDPGANGYGCNAVAPSRLPVQNKKEVMFYIKSIASGATITLQWKDLDDTDFTDYAGYTTVGRHVIREIAKDTEWQAIIKNAAQGTGTSVFGLSW